MILETTTGGESDIETVTPEAETFTGATPEPETDEADQDEQALVKDLTSWCASTREFWKPIFDKIEDEIDFCAGKQWPGGKTEGDKYVANITRRLVNQKVSQTYAKNPKAISRVRPQMAFTVWDGDMQSLEMARVAANDPAVINLAMSGDPKMVETLQLSEAILADYENGQGRKVMLKKWGRTLELFYDYQCDQQPHTFKTQMKAVVRRALTARAGWAKVGYRRQGDTANTSQGLDATTPDLIKAIALRLKQIEAGECENEEKARQEVESMQAKLAQGAEDGSEKLVDEGLVFDFPKTTSILVDRKCSSLKTLAGCDRIAQQFMLTPDEVERRYGVKVKGECMPYERGNPNEDYARNREVVDAAWPENADCCVWEVYDRCTQLKYVVCDGYKAFLEEPEAPPKLTRFWPLLCLTFNDVEVEDNCPDEDVTCYPPSDVRGMFHIQREFNRCREALRQHRIANRPWYIGDPRLTEKDRNDLASGAPANTVFMLEAPLPPGTRSEDVLTQVRKAPLDPAVYQSQYLETDMMLAIGLQQANLGPTSDATATEVSVAEGSRMQSGSSDVDDLDQFLSDFARANSELLLANANVRSVKLAVGPGATWPSTPQEIYNSELYLETEASGSGRPNRATEMATIRELMQFIMQLPGIDPFILARKILLVWDENFDLDELLKKELPSIMSMNRGAGQQQGAPPGDQKNPTLPGEAPPTANDPATSAAQQSPTTQGMPAQFQNKTAASASQPTA